MRILVTGSAGFIGYHLTTRLLAAGHHVIGLDSMNDYYDPRLKEHRNGLIAAQGGSYDFHQLDLADHEGLAALVLKTEPERIVHLAAQAGVRYSLIDPQSYERSNTLGTINLFEAARACGVERVVLASSSSVYGSNTKVPFAESDMTDGPVSLYAATKKAGELLAHAYHHLYGIEVAALRFFTVYGSWYRPDMGLFRFAKQILSGTPIQLFNQGVMERDFTHIDDIVDGISAALFKEKLAFEVYNLGSDRPVVVKDVIELLEKSMNATTEHVLAPMQAGDVVRTAADITKARRELGFEPKVSIEDGIARFGAWFKENKDMLLSLKDGR